MGGFPTREGKIAAAMDWLRQQLAQGPMPAGVVQRRGQAAGHSLRTLQAAATRLGIEPQRVYQDGRLARWLWSLPARIH